MKKFIGYAFIAIGLVLIGYGSFDYFEKYDDYLKAKNDSVYAGVYKADDDYATVRMVNDEIYEISFNDETYDFSFNGETYENNVLGLAAEFKNNYLIITKDGEELKVYSKEKK